MKTFFASLLGTVAGFLLLVVGGGLLLFLLVVLAAALGEAPKATITSDSYVVFDLSTNITDAPLQIESDAIVAALTGSDIPSQMQTRQVTRALREAATDDRIKGLLITGSFAPGGMGSSFATLQEVRRALQNFKASGKPVQSYIQYADTRDYFIASVADDVALDPNGAIFMPGLASEGTFFKGLFDKYGIGVQVVRVGEFKSAVEPYTRSDFSPENRTQLESLLGVLWTELLGTAATSRNLAPERFQSLLDSGEGYFADDVLEAGMVDRLIYRDELYAELKSATGVQNAATPFHQVALEGYIQQMGRASAAPEETPTTPGSNKGRVAVIYAEGVIVDGQGAADSIGGLKYAREIRRLRQDPGVKAIVLRVNSPGGSATASEHIARELRLAKETMPVVVSMGGYAASGGYWISAEADHIFAEPLTITGSIGVFGLVFNIEKLGADFGVTWDRVKTGKYADTLSISRAKTGDEMALLQKSTDKIYHDFIELVAAGRGLEPAVVESIASGRVWSGAQALDVGLVDETGGLADAIAYAANEAGLARGFRISEYPRKKDFSEVIQDFLEQLQPGSARGAIFDQLLAEAEQVIADMENFNDPRGVYARLPVDLTLN
jgi:protease-4